MDRRLVVVGVPGDRRIVALTHAMQRSGLAPPIVVAWRRAIEDPAFVATHGRPGDGLRVESPGSDLDTWHRLSRLGGSAITVQAEQWRPGRAWFAGLAIAMRAIETATPHLVPTHPASDVLAMTDKLDCDARLRARGVPVPTTMAAPTTTGELREVVVAAGLHAVFVKPRWGSSGAGVFAWRRNGARERLTTTARMVDGHLLNHKRLSHYADPAEIDRMLAPVLADGAIVQRWIPKAGTHGGPFDLRVLVVRGRIAHRVARVGQGTITNLHLDGMRVAVEDALARFGPRIHAALDEACLGAASAFCRDTTVAVDVMIDPRGRPFVLECNAWGDYLPRLLYEGLDTYEAQLRA